MCGLFHAENYSHTLKTDFKMAFITKEDYGVQAHNEVLKLLDNSNDERELRRAEGFAISQIKMRLSGRYDIQKIFDAKGDEREPYIVMIVIDIAIYHLYSQKSPRQIPEYRQLRYDDAMEWLNKIGSGGESADLPSKPAEEYKSKLNLFSLYPPSNNKY